MYRQRISSEQRKTCKKTCKLKTNPVSTINICKSKLIARGIIFYEKHAFAIKVYLQGALEINSFKQFIINLWTACANYLIKRTIRISEKHVTDAWWCCFLKSKERSVAFFKRFSCLN